MSRPGYSGQANSIPDQVRAGVTDSYDEFRETVLARLRGPGDAELMFEDLPDRNMPPRDRIFLMLIWELAGEVLGVPVLATSVVLAAVPLGFSTDEVLESLAWIVWSGKALLRVYPVEEGPGAV